MDDPTLSERGETRKLRHVPYSTTHRVLETTGDVFVFAEHKNPTRDGAEKVPDDDFLMLDIRKVGQAIRNHD